MDTLKKYLPIAFVVLVIPVVVAYGVQYSKSELRKTYDSHDYVKASESLSVYLSGRNADGVSYLHRPPVIPAYLHGFANKDQAAKWLNFFCYLCALLLIFFLGRVAGLIFPYALLYSLLAAIFYPWLQNFFFLWSEPLFSALALLLVFYVAENKSVAVVILICLLLFFTRKAGLFLGGGTCLVYLLDGKLKNAIWVTVVFAFAFLGWEVFSFTIVKESASENIFLQLVFLDRSHYVDAITGWFLPRSIPVWVRSIALIFGALLLLRYYKKEIMEIIARPKLKAVSIMLATYLLSFVIFFGAPDYYEAERFVSPLIPFALLVVLSFIQEVSFRNDKRDKWIVILFFIWLAYPVSRALVHLHE